MADKIKIVVDSPADIPNDIIEKYNIDVIPSLIIVNDETFKDFYEMNSERFCKILETADDNTSFSTAQPQLESFLDCFKKWTEEGYKIVCITISSEGSGTYQTANLAKQYLLDEIPSAQVEIIDSKTYSLVYGHAAIEGAKMAIDGADLDSVISRINEVLSSGNAFFVTDTLKYLKRGGRVNPAVATIGEILNIKPVLVVENGVINSLEKIRGSKKIIPRVIELLKATAFTPDCPIYVLDGGNKKNVEDMKNALKDSFGIENPPIAKIGSAILMNTGPGLAGVIYFTKP